jgi:hypothetical protein
MRTYCWECSKCGRTTERPEQDWCACQKMGKPTKMKRDYQTEAVNIGAGVKT